MTTMTRDQMLSEIQQYGHSAREVVERETDIVRWEIGRTACCDRNGYVESHQDTMLRGWTADGAEYVWRCHDGGDLGGEVTVRDGSPRPGRVVLGVTYSPDDRCLDLDADTGELVYHDTGVPANDRSEDALAKAREWGRQIADADGDSIGLDGEWRELCRSRQTVAEILDVVSVEAARAAFGEGYAAEMGPRILDAEPAEVVAAVRAATSTETQADAATLLGVSQSVVSNWLAGRKEMSRQVRLVALAHLGVLPTPGGGWRAA